jgi:soluble lytic murein transglycosylase-like protein/TolA-binding protein
LAVAGIHHTLGPMSFVVTLLLLLGPTSFELKIDQAYSQIESQDWNGAAVTLDQAGAEQPAMFAANNFHYLRGRVAEHQGDWVRAKQEFAQIASDNPLYPLALWHYAVVATKLRDDAAVLNSVSSLPANFPRELKLRLAHEASRDVSLRVYQDDFSREARLERARALGDTKAIWNLIRENKDDDVALDAARIVAPTAETAADEMAIAEIFAGHRQFEEALPLYQRAANDKTSEAEVRFRIARIHFQQEKFALSIDEYRALIKDFPGTDWEKEADYQIPSCYWRLGDFRNSEKAYLDYIQKYGQAGMREAATRNLVDVYRALGENQKALTTLDRALATRLSIATQQVFLFTKAKILYTEKRYAAALAIFQQLGRVKLRSAPGSATEDEVKYFQALSQSKLGNKTAATTIWQQLARDRFSYYGQRAAEKLGKEGIPNTAPACLSERNTMSKNFETELASLRHPLRDDVDSSADIVSELVFLRLWDEAAEWLNWSNARPERRQAASIAYLGGQFDRSISFANRLPKTNANLPLQYPAGYRQLICDASSTRKTDPLWLQAIIWQESKYDPTSRSGAGARGLMQFIPETASAVAASIGMPSLSVEKLYDPAVSIQLGGAYWASLMEKFKSPEMALAAYNGGPDNVERWRSKSSDPELFVSDIGFVETKKYVMLVFAARAAYGMQNN